MKKLFTLLLAVALISTVSFAQNTSPRFIVYGTNDASSISFGQATLADAASATLDTVKFYPRHQQVNINLTVADSCTITYGSLAGVYKGDRLWMYITTPAQTGVLKLLGNFMVSTGTKTLSLTASKHWVLEWWFDGVNYVEMSRAANY